MKLKKVLVVDDEQSIRFLLSERLKRLNVEVLEAEHGEIALTTLNEKDVEVVLTDLKMPVLDGFSLLEKISNNKEWSHIQVIVITGHGDKEAAVECLKKGAFDFIEKPFDLDVISRRVENALAVSHQRKITNHIVEAHELSDKNTKSSKFKLPNELAHSLELIAQEKFAPILLLGESGVGKEVAAKAIHAVNGSDGGASFIAVNCAAIPANLLESELFGHEKGSFSGASGAKVGLVELASSQGSTLFLDEIGDLGFDLQAKLLRFIQERTFRRVGGTREHLFEGRLIAATCKDLEEEVKRKNFREDLYYRLSVLKFELPRLFDRDDKVEIAKYILEEELKKRGLKSLRFSDSARDEICGYSWPGNIRELKNAIERVIILRRFDSDGMVPSIQLPQELKKISPISSTDVHKSSNSEPFDTITGTSTTPPIDLSTYRQNLLNLAEKNAIEKAIEAANGNKSKAAELLGIDRSTLNRILKRIAS